ncbi:hypothetical protein ABEF92_004807 [Exophiala dermatitidis]|uniref:Ribonuclease P n=1 Tax=Exophiala dermatitidis (strain ATCC 34100 / CBS 525.76 / NIH/UT8656) TaxID=858893 RepID=H6BWP7_EXODN|nr:ribonuclease P [Exophiala dermatitidis NIH/UT8656]EHY56108.1 ribonuclease P [Exophiala dermatitidis NIH/UT8656]
MQAVLFPSETLQSAPSPKIHFSTGSLPSYVSADPAQAPTKKAPWKQVRDVGFVRSVTVVVPGEMYRAIFPRDESGEIGVSKLRLRYAKVIMKLEDVLSGDFFTEYVKRGNILMLSEGQPGVDNVFSLKDGVLRLELGKEVYERTGLQGTTVRSGGRKHIKSRFLVEYNLRLPSMLHGKKGFERLVWAARNVLNHSVQWLFVDLRDDHSGRDLTGPITAYHPTVVEATPRVRELAHVVGVPKTLSDPAALTTTTNTTNTTPAVASTKVPEDVQESILDLFEYIDMLALGSPRLDVSDHVDPFISRYRVSDQDQDQDTHTHAAAAAGSSSSTTTSKTIQVMTLTWTGLIPTEWILELLCEVIKRSRKSRRESKDRPRPSETPTEQQDTVSASTSWLALSVTAHKTQTVGGRVDGYTVILQPDTGDNNHDYDDDMSNGDGDIVGDNDNEMDYHTSPQSVQNQSQSQDQSQEGKRPRPSEKAETDNGNSKRLRRNEDGNGNGTTTTPTSSLHLHRHGFYRYICAEYVDSLV